MIHVRSAKADDVDPLAALMTQMDRFYGATDFDPVEVRIRQIVEALFGDQPAAHALLAFDDDELIGFAAYSYLWPAVGLTRSLYLKELYVDESRRGQGVGEMLMKEVFTVAARHGCSRVEWATDCDNPRAQQFYARLGFEEHVAKVDYRAEGSEIAQAANRLARHLVKPEREECGHGM